MKKTEEQNFNLFAISQQFLAVVVRSVLLGIRFILKPSMGSSLASFDFERILVLTTTLV